MSTGLWIAIAVVAILVIAALVIGTVRYRRRQISLQRTSEAATPIDRSGGYSASSGITFTQSSGTGLPGVGDDAAVPRDSVKRPIAQVKLPEPAVIDETVARDTTVTAMGAQAAQSDVGAIAPAGSDVGAIAPADSDVGAIAPPAGRLERLRGRLAKSQNAFGRSLLGLLGGGDLDEASWDEIEDTLLIADLGPAVTASVVAKLRAALAANTVSSEAEARAVLREVLIGELHGGLDRSIKALPHADKPSVLLVVGVNGTGKTTTVGKLARVLVADGRRVVLGAADTFRAAAADQLQTWASRVGAEVVRGAEGADPASVAFDAVDRGIAVGADVVVIDTAGRLHTKTGLMDELGKVKRVVEKRAAVDE
ncbi:MAG: signal recognition particle receptor subunit alpha, partial [Mycobacterium sp.]|nr:signal recognition particle receptor subunit alpha [Mycobacterium sp.]